MQHFDIRSNNTASNIFSLFMPLALWVETFVAFPEKETDPVIAEDSLKHGESLFVLSTCDFEDVASVLFAEWVSFNFFRYSLLIKDSPNNNLRTNQGICLLFLLVVDFDDLCPAC